MKKILQNNLLLQYYVWLSKILKVMKITLLLLILGLSNIYASVYSQSIKVDLNLKNVALKDAFESIEKQTNFKFLFRSDLINVNQTITLNNSGNSSLNELLCKLFKNTKIVYDVINDNLIVLSPEQSKKISGTVTNATTGEPIIGAIVRIEGTSKGVITDVNGKFSLDIAQSDAVVVVSFLGYNPAHITVNGLSVLDIKLVPDITKLDEVVVMGYTTQNRRDVTGAVAKINMQALADNPSASILSLLSGQAAGMQSIMRSGTPGAAGGGLVIRGNTSLSADDGINGMSNPLYIIDGMPISIQDLAGFDVSQNDFFSTLNPNEIKSIDILKDAAATAIYGSRGANGVIVITTKRGTSGEPRFSASATSGAIMSPPKLNVYTGEAEREQKLKLMQQTLTNLFGNQAWVDVRNGMEVMGYMLPSVLTDKYNPAFNNAYDFQDMFYQTGITQNYDLSMDGGSDKSSYRIGLNHYNEKGVLVGYGFNRTTLNASLVNDISRYFHNDFSVRYSYLDRKGGLNSYMLAMPTSPTALPSSLFYKTPAELELMTGGLGDAYNKNVSQSLSLNDAFQVKFSNNLSLNNQASVNMDFGSNNYFIPATFRANNENYAQSQSSTNSTFNANSVLNYNKKFNDHQIIALVGTEINEVNQQMSWTQADNGSSDYLKVIQGFQKGNINGYSDIVKTNMLSYFGSLSYGYKENRYKVEGVLRRDASSRFGANNKWATFPSIKGQWVFSKEPWMEGCSNWLDFGKVRLSYGSSGSIAGDPLLQYNSLISTTNIGAGMNDIYSDKMQVQTYGGQTSLISDFTKVSNQSLSWSKSTEINYGIDLELLNKRVFITGDVYSKYLSGLVYTSNLPSELGFTSIQSNLVDMINNGFELSLNAYLFPRTSDFQWEWTLNLSKSKTIVAKLGNGGRDYINGNYAFVVGEPAFQYYLPEYIGPLNSLNDLPVNPMTGQALKYSGGDAGLALNLQGKIFPGMPLFTDVNGDYQIDASGGTTDNKIIPNKSPEPKIMGGLHTTIRYKNLSLRLQSSFAFGNYIYNTTLQQELSAFDDASAFFTKALYKFDNIKFWTAPGCGAYYPMIYVSYSDGGSVRSFKNSSMFLEKGDYWSLDNATLSYNLPKKILSILHSRGMNIYGTATNVFMWKASRILDPRQVSKTGYYNGNGYPISRSFILGLQLQF
jgi:iron complex outermembrane receptor protein